VEIPEEGIEAAARHYAIFAFDEGSKEEIRASKDSFNELVNVSYVAVTKSALMAGFHRPTASEFRTEFITECRKYLRRRGMA
jgi:hypothetical protein